MINYIILGIVQGLSEFLPVSSSAHLLIMQKLLNLDADAVALQLILHLGTCLALVIFFFKDILKLFRDFRMLMLIIVVTAITGIIGLSGKDFFESLFASVRGTALQLMITGLILIAVKRFMDAKRRDLNIKDALVLGVSQAAAIIPGISRSGLTVSALLLRGVEREAAFRFSFLASIPAVLGAAILEAKEIGACPLDIKNSAIGFVFSLLTGILSLWTFRFILKKAKLHYFGYYCILIAVITLLFLK